MDPQRLIYSQPQLQPNPLPLPPLPNQSSSSSTNTNSTNRLNHHLLHHTMMNNNHHHHTSSSNGSSPLTTTTTTIQPPPQPMMLLSTSSSTTPEFHPLIADQQTLAVPILYQQHPASSSSSPSSSSSSNQQQQSSSSSSIIGSIPNNYNPQQQQAVQQQHTSNNMYNNTLQSSPNNNLIYNNNNNNTAMNNTMNPIFMKQPPSLISPNNQQQQQSMVVVPFSALPPLNQSINNNLISTSKNHQQQEVVPNYDPSRRPPPSISTIVHNHSSSSSTTVTNNSNSGSVNSGGVNSGNSNSSGVNSSGGNSSSGGRKNNSPPSPSPITKFANKVIDIITPGERATYVNLSSENQSVSTGNISTNQKSKGALKGLSNPIGEYNCFLNVVIQSLWNLEIFRELFLSIDPKNHKHKSFESCVYCSLQNLFTHFKYSENSILDPNLVRNSLSFAHNKDSKFQLKHMDDASEVFQAIIEDINNSLEYSQIPIFDFYVTDFYVCSKCNTFSDPHNYTTTNWCISSCEFVQKKRENPSISFEGAVRSTIESFHRTCESCKERSDSQKHIFQVFPAVTSFSFSWNRNVISEDDILEFMSYFKIKQIKLHEIFRLNCNGSDIEVMGHVSSIICYYGRHYICLVYNKKLELWFAIDDSNVRQIDADRLEDFIVSSKFQPCVVLVEVDSHKGNIKIENRMKEKATTNEIELISPNKKRIPTSDSFPSRNGESLSPNTESQFTIVDQHFGVVIEGFNAVTDFFYWKRKISTHADIYTRTVTLTKDQIQTMSSQLNICIYLGSLELLDNETVTIRLSFTQNQKNKSQLFVIGKLDNKKKSTFASIPIGFLIAETSKNYELNFYIKKEKVV